MRLNGTNSALIYFYHKFEINTYQDIKYVIRKVQKNAYCTMYHNFSFFVKCFLCLFFKKLLRNEVRSFQMSYFLISNNLLVKVIEVQKFLLVKIFKT